MSEEDSQGPDDGSLEARLRWIGQQVGKAIEALEDLDVDKITRAVGVDPDRVQEYLDNAQQWITEHGEELNGEAAQRFSGLVDAMRGAVSVPATGDGPDPRDVPTEPQGLALSAIDSGRWAVQPGSNVISTTGEGAAPKDSMGLVGELRARDWINASGDVTVVGQRALKRWLETADTD